MVSHGRTILVERVRKEADRDRRLWIGRTKAEDYDTYLAYLEESGVAELHATPGNKRVMVLRRLDGDQAGFSVMSFWARSTT